MKKKIISTLLILTIGVSNVSASILGTQMFGGSSLVIGKETTLYQNTFVSEQKGVGLQTEYYAEYTPNKNVTPVVVTGESIWGKRTITEAAEYMRENNMYPMIGINASFFSLQTGIPMGHVISDGKITSKDATELDAIGFDADGNGFISRLGIKTTATFDEYEFDIAHINKYCQATTDVLTLFTDDFGTETNSTEDTINVILGNIKGKLAIGETLTADVEQVFFNHGSLKIPEGKIVLTLNTTGNAWINTLLNLISIGETITIKNEATTDSNLWNSAQNALASEGKRLLENGVVNRDLEAGAAPRTAVGITETGSIIFYVIDGRQTGYSYGVKQSTLAERMKELGCVDALNLDGGGSTSIAGVYPGQNATSVINSPSDGSLRKVTNFIFLKNSEKPNGELGRLYLYPYSEHYLSGSTVKLYPSAVDTAFHYMNVPFVEYSMENDLGNITDSGVLTLSGTGEAKVKVTSGNITGSAGYYTYESPTDIQIYNSDTNKKISSLSLDKHSVVNLIAKPYFNGKYLISTPELFTWEIDSHLGTIENGKLTLSGKSGSMGNLRVKAGETVQTIPVKINYEADPEELYPYSEIFFNDNKIVVDIYSNKGVLDLGNCYILIDGENVFDSATKELVSDTQLSLTIPVDENFANVTHKILVKTQNQDGHSALNSYNVKADTSASKFDDTKNHWAKDVIAYMNTKKIVNGDGENFYPDNNMTRAEFAVMMCGYLGIDVSKYADNELTFSDNQFIPFWAENYVKAAVDLALISGRKEGDKTYFAPNDNITRAEAASIIVRSFVGSYRRGELDFKDYKDIPEWARDSIAIITNAGFMSGYPDNTIGPNKNITRAEAACLLFNAY